MFHLKFSVHELEMN